MLSLEVFEACKPHGNSTLTVYSSILYVITSFFLNILMVFFHNVSWSGFSISTSLTFFASSSPIMYILLIPSSLASSIK